MTETIGHKCPNCGNWCWLIVELSARNQTKSEEKAWHDAAGEKGKVFVE